MNKISELILRKEPFIFFIIAVLNLLAIFMLDFYYSVDGPQHMLVAKSISELIKGNEEVARYIKINDLIVGYWTGTFILALFKLIMSAKLAMKLLLAVYYLGIAYSFRYLVRSFSHAPTLITLLIIPFSANYFIGNGYLNFCLGFILMFLSLGYYIRKFNNFNWKSMLIMALLLILGFLTHAFVFAFTGLQIALFLLFKIVNLWIQTGNIKKTLKVFGIQLLIIILFSLPAIILWINYVISIQEITDYVKVQYVSKLFLAQKIRDISILSWFVKEPHYLTNKAILLLLVFLVIFTVTSRIRSIFGKVKNAADRRMQTADFCFITMIIIALLYFFYPNKLITGNISSRLLLFLFFAILTWLSTQKYPAWISIVVLIAIIPISYMKWNIRMDYLPKMGKKAVEIQTISKSMEENAVYAAINYSKIWTEGHLTCMPGIDKTLIFTYTPQTRGQFPIVVNKTSCPRLYLGTKNVYTSKLYWSLIGDDSNPERPVDYVVLINRKSYAGTPDQQIVMEELRKYYILTDSTSSKSAYLYELRNRKQLVEAYNDAINQAEEKIKGTEQTLKGYYLNIYLDLLDKYSLINEDMSEEDK